MKVKSSIKRICTECKIIRRNKKISIKCANVKHKQRQN